MIPEEIAKFLMRVEQYFIDGIIFITPVGAGSEVHKHADACGVSADEYLQRVWVWWNGKGAFTPLNILIIIERTDGSWVNFLHL